MQNKRKILIPLIIIAVLTFILIGFFVPVKMDATLKNKELYEGIAVGKEDVSVTETTLFGKKKEVKDFYLYPSEKENFVDVVAGRFVKRLKVNPIGIKSIIATYPDDVYQYEGIDESKVKAKVNYANGTSKDISNFSLKNLPSKITEDVTVTVDTSFGEGTLTLSPIPVQSVEAKYEGSPHIGDLFKADHISATITYKDGRTIGVKNFTCDAPEKITGKLTINVYTAYGDTTCEVVPVGISDIVGTYDGDTYEGDMLDASKISAEVTMKDGTVVEVEDVSVEEDAQIFKEDDYSFNTVYGTGTVHIVPHAVTNIEANGTSVPKKGGTFDFETLVFTYDDGTRISVEKSDVEFITSLKTALKEGDNIFEFVYKNIKYELNVNIEAVSAEEVAAESSAAAA